MRLTGMTRAGMASQRRFAAVAGVLVVAALAGCRAAQPGPGAPPGVLPGVTGGGVRALWQGAPWQDLTISGGLDDGFPGVAAAGTWPGAGRERRGSRGRSCPG